MRHQNKVKKLGRDASHRKSLLANLVVSLIDHKRIKTTLPKAKAMRTLAERMVTLGKRGDLHARRLAVAYLRHKGAVGELFSVVAPAHAERKGGYTRIIKLGQRYSDAAPMAVIEWVDITKPIAGQTVEVAGTEAAADDGVIETAAEEVAADAPAAEAPAPKRAPKKKAE